MCGEKLYNRDLSAIESNGLQDSSPDDETLDDKGPWSKAEAYLLFDWFPPGRNKLALGNVEEIPAQ